MEIRKNAEWLRKNISEVSDRLDIKISTKAARVNDLLQIFMELEECITAEDATAARIHKISTLIFAAEQYAGKIESEINDTVRSLLKILTVAEEVEQYFYTQAENGGD